MVIKKKENGFTLVESLTSAAILSIAIIAIITVIRRGREFDISAAYRMRARAVIDSCFEDTSYAPGNYASFVNRANVQLDLFPGVRCRLDITGAENEITGPDHPPHKRVRARVRWDVPEGTDAVILEKWISEQ